VKSADETAEIMLNGKCATTLMKLFIVYRKCEQLLKDKNIEIVAKYAHRNTDYEQKAGDELRRVVEALDEQPRLL